MTDPAARELREKAARIIDPYTFIAYASLRQYCLDQGDDAETAKRYADDVYGHDCGNALTKADAILALSPSAVAGDDSLAVQREMERYKEGYRNGVKQMQQGAPQDLCKRLLLLKSTSPSIYGPLIDQTIAALAAPPAPVEGVNPPAPTSPHPRQEPAKL